jgi:NAD(P)H-flavin reductase
MFPLNYYFEYFPQILPENQAEIIVADSVQIYKFLNIGANKPSREERAAVRHHLVDVLDPSDPDQTCSSGQFARMAQVRRSLVELTVCLSVLFVCLFAMFILRRNPTQIHDS